MGTATKQQNKVPELRFSGFCGKWTMQKLEELVTRHNSGVYKKSDLYGEGCNIVGVSDLYGCDKIDGQVFRLVPLTPDEIEKHTLNEGDLIYSESSLVRDGIAKTLYATKNGEGTAFAWHTRRFTLEDKIFTPYAYYFLESQSARKYLMSVATQTALTGMTTKDYFKLPFCYPPKQEQQKIADFLGSVDDWLDNLRSQKTALQTYKQGMMQKLFTQQVRFKDRSGNDFPEWEEKKLGEVCKVRTGKKDVNQGNPNGKYPFFTCAKQHTYSDEYSFDCEAILIAGNGEVGHSLRYSGKFEAYQRTYILSDFKISHDYMWTVINTLFSDYVTNQTQMGAMPYIKLGTLIDFVVPTPTVKEQQKIADFLTSLDKGIESKQQQITKAEEWKKGLMQKMFI